MTDATADAMAILGLMNLPRVGTASIHRILEAIGQRETPPRFLLEHDATSLVDEELLTEDQAARYTSDEQRAWRVETVNQVESADIRLIHVSSAMYPDYLRRQALTLAPPLLMVRGNADMLRAGGIAFAGARKTTEHGLEIAQALVREAVRNRFTVVSGGAQGTDAVTHEEALLHDGTTIVVLAEGILSSRARHLDNLIDNGRTAIVSTFLPHDAWAAWRAMERNRYILSLSDRLVVTEAGVRGGTLAAGREALKAGIDTWVLDYADPPGSASGNRLLLEAGARSIPVSEGGEVATPPEMFAIGDWLVRQVRN